MAEQWVSFQQIKDQVSIKMSLTTTGCCFEPERVALGLKS
jgi:hypothetical protein